MRASRVNETPDYTDAPVTTTPETWSPATWRGYPALQQPEWPDPEAVEAALVRLKASPPLVFAGEARELRASLERVQEGRAFLLQAGDCVESFNELSTVEDPREAEDPAADVGRADVRRDAARGEGRPDSGPVHQAALGADRAHRRRRAAVVPRPHGERRRADPRGADPRPAAHDRGLQPVGCDAEPAAGVHEGRLCRPDGRCTSGTRSSSPARREGRRYEQLAERDRARAALHGRLRDRPDQRAPRCTRWTSGRATRACCSTTRRA